MKTAILVLPLILAACAAPDLKRTVHIDSEPRGARIFFGVGPKESDAEKTRNFLGVTPLDWVTVADPNGGFPIKGALIYSTFVPGAAVFTAEPPSGQTNLFSKRQVFHGGGLINPPDKVPEGIFFDLTKP
jgi:hypothetical protein